MPGGLNFRRRKKTGVAVKASLGLHRPWPHVSWAALDVHPRVAVRSLGGRGADVVYDATGHDTFEASLDMLTARATLVLYGQSSGPVAPFDPGRLSGITGVGRGAGSLTLR